MKYILALFFLSPIIVFSQDFSGNWEDLFSYNQIQDLAFGDGKVYAAAENAVFTYQRNTGEVEKISSVNGLSGENISSIHYSSGYNLLIVGYENGFIDIYETDEEQVLRIVDIFEKQTIPPPEKKINHFYEYNDRLFISTDFGISEYNLANREFGDTYFIGDGGSRLKVNQLTVYQNFIYASTEENGVKFAGINNPNLIDFNVWQTISSGTYLGITTLNNTLFAVNENNTLERLQQNTFVQELQFNQPVRDLRVTDNRLVVSLVNRVRIYDENLSAIANIGNPSGISVNYTAALIYLNDIYIADLQEGLLQTRTTSPFTFNALSPDGPLRNNVFDLEAIPNEVWVTYGDYDISLNPYNPNLKSFGISHFQNNEWINIPYEDIQAKNLVNTAINPNNTNQVFVSSFYDGLVQIDDNQVTEIYNQENSPIDELIVDGLPVPNDTRVNGASFDGSGKLWMNVARVQNGLISFSPDTGNFETYDVSETIPEPQYYSENSGFTDLITDPSGNIYFGSSSFGVIGFQPSTNTFSKVTGGEEQGNLPDNQVNSLALDNNNQLWIGTIRGLRVLFNPSGMFSNSTLSANEIIIQDDDGVAQELLAGISILAITVDGNNNKWIATDAGAFYLSSNGQETIYQFTKENSPLPSNTVTDIAIDENSGKVYIGTDQGLLAFRGSATASAENLENVRAFPNPVRPNYSGMVTIDGLIENANVKITDIEGNLVYEKVSEGGSIQWDTRAFGKHKVASGVYMVLITSDDQLETKVTKIMIIR